MTTKVSVGLTRIWSRSGVARLGGRFYCGGKPFCYPKFFYRRRFLHDSICHLIKKMRWWTVFNKSGGHESIETLSKCAKLARSVLTLLWTSRLISHLTHPGLTTIVRSEWGTPDILCGSSSRSCRLRNLDLGRYRPIIQASFSHDYSLHWG